MPAVKERPWRVKHTPGPEGTRRERTVFAGNEKDARLYVENNFPRPHIEPGMDYTDEGLQPDVALISPTGDVHHYFGPGDHPFDTENGWVDTTETVGEDAEDATADSKYQGWKRVELVNECRARGLGAGGNIATLVQRLEDDDTDEPL